MFDNVLDEETVNWLHDEAIAMESTEDDISFEFPLEIPSKHSSMEQILNQILLELYPPHTTTKKYYVEYWSRPEWMLIAAHADMDEGYERKMQTSQIKGYGNQLKHPETGHVLYLKVGSRVKGPTVVWNVTRGGDFVERSDEASEMIIVPAVQGRLTRFQGNLLHAVPRDADLFWTFEIDGRGNEPTEFYQRSVVLFNLWPKEKGLPLNMVVSKPSSSYHNDDSLTTTTTTTTISKSCNPIEQWNEIQTVSLPDTEESTTTTTTTTTTTFQVPLMGNRERRGMDDYVVKLQTHESARKAFSDQHQVTSCLLYTSPSPRDS